MKSYSRISLNIAFKIWMIALLVNTIAITFIIDAFGDVAGMFLLVGFIGGIFSAPIFFVIYGMIHGFLKNEKTAAYILKWLLIAGVSLSVAAWAVFTNCFRDIDNELLRLMLAAPLSGAMAICTAYPNIKKACLIRDQNNTLPKFDAEQTVAA